MYRFKIEGLLGLHFYLESIRQYIPKGTDISSLTDGFIMKVQKKIDTRPREKLNFSTPKEEFSNFVCNIALAS